MNSPAEQDQQQGRNMSAVVGTAERVYPVVKQPHGGSLIMGRGRPKGQLSKWSRKALQSVEAVYKGLGGVEAMTEWARENPSDFYRGIYAKLLPSQYMVDQRHTHQVEPAAMTDADLLRVIALATRPEILDWAKDKAADAAAVTGEAMEPVPLPEPTPDHVPALEPVPALTPVPNLGWVLDHELVQEHEEDQ